MKLWFRRRIMCFFFYKQWHGQDWVPAFAVKGELEAVLGFAIPALAVPKLG
jgi:hypothetical protein